MKYKDTISIQFLTSRNLLKNRMVANVSLFWLSDNVFLERFPNNISAIYELYIFTIRTLALIKEGRKVLKYAL
jgi:hypothetical protein